MNNPINTSSLLKLVGSLKSNEKRYITIYLTKHKDQNNLLRLYKIISNDPSITDADIQKKTNDAKFVAQLRENKYTLYQLILDALHQFDLRKSPYARILTMLHQSELLLNKGLTEARMELLLKAGHLADEYELPVLKLEIVRLRNGGITEPGFLKETERLANGIIEHARLKHLVNRMATFINKMGNRLTLTQRKQYGKLLNSFKKKSTKQDSFYGKYVSLSFLINYYRASGEHTEGYKNGIKILNLFKQYPQMLRIQMWRSLYGLRLNDLLIVSSRVSKNETSGLVYDEIRNLDISTAYKNIVDVNVLDSYIQMGEFKNGEKFLNDIQTRMPNLQIGPNLHDRFILYFNLASMNFGLGIYSKALFWLNEILNMPNKQLVNYPYTNIVRLTRLIVYYELNKLDLLEYEIRSTSNYIVKHGHSFTMDQVVMDYLLKIISIKDKTELRELMEEALSKLSKLTKIKSEARTLDIFDFISWFESKIENRSFAEIMKEKARRQAGINF